MRIKKAPYLVTAALTAILSTAAPTFGNFIGNDASLEQSLQNCAEHKFDGLMAQKLLDGKCVAYIKFKDEELILIYEPLTYEIGYLTLIQNNPNQAIERNRVRRISLLPGKESYEPIEDIVLKADERLYLIGLFREYKRELTKN